MGEAMADVRPTSTGVQRYLLGVWIGVAVLTPLIAFLGARGFAPLIAVAGALCLPVARPRREDWPLLILLALLAVWAAISAIWSPAPNLKVLGSLKDLQRFTALHMLLQLVLSGAFVIASLRMTADTAERAIKWVGYGLLVLAVIVVVEGLSQAAIYQAINHLGGKSVRPDLAVRNVSVGGYVIVVLLWPIGAALQRRGRLVGALALMAAVAASTFLLRGDAPTLAAVVSAVAFVAALKGGRPAILALMALVVAYLLLTPWIMITLQKTALWATLGSHLPISWDRRMDIWRFTTAQLMHSPWLGLGLDASRTFPGIIALHPHDGALQLWFELGVIGAGLAAAFWGLIFWRLAKPAENRLFAAMASAMAVVYLVIGAFSFSVWQEWWICLGAFGMATCLAVGKFIDLDPYRFEPGPE
jgi:O-antigen ligase